MFCLQRKDCVMLVYIIHIYYSNKRVCYEHTGLFIMYPKYNHNQNTAKQTMVGMLQSSVSCPSFAGHWQILL